MAIQDSINSALGSVSQVSAMAAGIHKLNEQNEIKKMEVQNQLDQIEGDIANEIRIHDQSAPEGRISAEYIDQYLGDKVKLEEDKYNQSFKELKDQRKVTGEAAGKREVENTPINNLAYGREVKKENKLMSDMDMANRAAKVLKDKITTMETLRKQRNILGSNIGTRMRNDLKDKFKNKEAK